MFVFFSLCSEGTLLFNDILLYIAFSIKNFSTVVNMKVKSLRQTDRREGKRTPKLFIAN